MKTMTLLFSLVAAIALVEPPPTAVRPTVDVYHGVNVDDPYRWLENWNDPAVRTWTDAQNDYARSQLDALPFMSQLRIRVKALGGDTHAHWSDVQYRHGALFAIKTQPPREQPFLVRLTSADDLASERTVMDPAVLDPTGKTAIDFYVPSLDGSKVAVSLSVGGNERGDVHVFDVQSGKKLPDVIPRVNGGTAGGSVAWNADGTGFFYTRYPRPGERPEGDLDFYQQLYFHTLGSATDKDTYEIGKDSPKIAETIAQSSDDGRFVLVTVNNGDGGEKALFVRSSTGGWARLAGYPDEVVSGTWGKDDALYLLSRKDAPRGQILRIARSTSPTLADAKVVVPQSDMSIQSMVVTTSRIYVNDLAGGPSQLRVFDLAGKLQQKVALEPISSVTDLEPLDGDDVLYSAQSYVTPPAYYRVGPRGAPAKTALAVTSPADYSDTLVTRVDATSKDGTKIPLNIVMRKGTALNGKNPTLLYGYGGYLISEVPSFSPTRRVWLDQGGIYVVANIRGGGEFGDAWHQAGKLTKKQNVFDDFYAAAKYLVDQRYTSPASLAIMGGSNGGLLMGATLTQHPEMFRAVVSHVGIYDMMRFELYPNGAFNVTEFGSVSDAEQFRALYAYSPLHHVVDGTKYPAVILFSGTNDPRVNPADSRKFAARLQAATKSGYPILLRISGSGHGFGTSLSDGLSQTVDQYAFLFWQLGMMPTFPTR
ncbi:MAG TPA: prolyl oligopeptidase family serine peptidase [Vicinamibacterales bacterium]|nr:prolyl oligopeptidase family serine peptidase [Vicinamibacterales bacterium]